MANNKIIYNGNTLIDLTQDTVTEADVAEGKTFHKANGESAVGVASGGDTLYDAYINRTLEDYELDSTFIPSYMFARSSIKAITGNNVTVVQENGFYACVNLEEVELPLVENIGEKAFSYCNKIILLNLPSVQTIQNNAFESCNGITSLIAPNLKNIYPYAFSGAFNKTVEEVALNLPELTHIQDYALQNSGITSLNVPKLQWLGSYSLQNTRIASLVLPSSVTTLGLRCLYNIPNVKNISIQSNLTSIPNMIHNCPQLEVISLLGCTQVPTLAAANYFNVPSTCIIQVPASLEEEWKQATNWSSKASQIVGV